MSKLNLFVFVLLILNFTSCSLVQKASLSTMSGVFYDAGFSMEKINNWSQLEESLPAVVTLNDSLLSLSPSDDGLILTSLKGYAAQGFAIHETRYIADQINLEDDSLHKRNALISYSKALALGKRYLEKRGVNLDELVKADIPKVLDRKLSTDFEDFEAVFFTAQSLGGILNLNKDKMTYISQLPIVKGMFDWVCGYRPDFNHGSCDIFYGAYEAGRPKMLGGNPAKGKEIFLNLIEKQPHNWLARVSYMQYYLIPMMDEEGYRKQKFHLENYKKLLEQAQIWNPEKSVQIQGNASLRIYQAIAIERYKIIKKLEKDIF